jgi:predicted DNA-binding transcriptional regulator AlpA
MKDSSSLLIHLTAEDMKNLIKSSIQEMLPGFANTAKSDNPEVEYLSAAQVMKVFKISARSTLWLWERQGLIPHHIKVPGSRRKLWRKSDLDATLNKSDRTPKRR